MLFHPPEEAMADRTTSEEWAFEISLDRLKAEITKLLRDHSADEVKEIMAARSDTEYRAESPDAERG